jgi:glutathione S-transferase
MLTLYALPTCPFCARVRMALNNMGLSFTELNIQEGENEKKLIELGGKRQVPYLIDDEKNVAMYESEDIVNYLETEYGNKEGD